MALTPSEREQVRREIGRFLEHLGYVPPMRDLGERFGIPPVTAWRIVRSLGWRANYRHHWFRVDTDTNVSENES